MAESETKSVPTSAAAAPSVNIDAILRGNVTCSDPVLSKAFHDGLRAVQTISSDVLVEVTPGLLPALISHPHPAARQVGRLTLDRMIGDALGSGAEAAAAAHLMDLTVSAGLGDAIVQAACTACSEASSSSSSSSPSAASSAALEPFRQLLKLYENRKRPLPEGTVVLADAASFLRLSELFVCLLQTWGADRAMLPTVSVVWQFFVWAAQAQSAYEHVDEAADTVYNSVAVQSAVLHSIQLCQHDQDVAFCFAQHLEWCAERPSWCDTFASEQVDGFRKLLDLVSSTLYSPDVLRSLVNVCCNACAGDDTGRMPALLVSAGALELLQPALLSPDVELVINICVMISTCALNKDMAEAVNNAQVLPLIADMLRCTPPSAVPATTVLSAQDVALCMQLLTADAGPTLNLIGMFNLLNADISDKKQREALLQPALVAAVRAAAASADAFVYAAAILLLKRLDVSIPAYRGDKHAGGVGTDGHSGPEAVAAWSIDDVCMWVGQQPFRQYRQHFRDALVTGRVLLSLDDAALADVGVKHPIHRRTIAFAIDDMRTASAAAVAVASGGSGSSSDASGTTAALSTSITTSLGSPMAPLGAAAFRYDVFISYRRVGGADFAHLLKLQLRAAGLEVFLDVENLGTGNFSDQLVSSLTASRNVILVWTKGCMDRFLDDVDTTNSDFVRLEYVQCLRLKKHAVPVYKEDFEFPAEGRLPPDVRGVLSLNAIKWIGEYREASFHKLKAALQC